MASKADNDEAEVESLASIFQEGLDLYNNLGKIDEPTNSASVQGNVRRAMRLLEKATKLTSLAGMFSRNESADEIATNNLQYLLLPALLGSLTMKLTAGDRKQIVDVAEIYFKDFLQRCNEYGLSNYAFKDGSSDDKKEESKPASQFEVLTVQVNSRSSKIQRFREQKDLQAKLDTLKANMQNEHADEEIKRDYFLTLIKLFIYEAVDELASIEREKPILEHMKNLRESEGAGATSRHNKRPQGTPLKPFIITKDEVQKAVFGAGYPSLPTMTVQDFYEKRVKDGIFPDPEKAPAGPMSLQQASLAGLSLYDDDKEADEKEKKIESDDPELLERMRNMDEFKDENRRGWGNRMNRS